MRHPIEMVVETPPTMSADNDDNESDNSALAARTIPRAVSDMDLLRMSQQQIRLTDDHRQAMLLLSHLRGEVQYLQQRLQQRDNDREKSLFLRYSRRAAFATTVVLCVYVAVAKLIDSVRRRKRASGLLAAWLIPASKRNDNSVGTLLRHGAVRSVQGALPFLLALFLMRRRSTLLCDAGGLLSTLTAVFLHLRSRSPRPSASLVLLNAAAHILTHMSRSSGLKQRRRVDEAAVAATQADGKQENALSSLNDIDEGQAEEVHARLRILHDDSQHDRLVAIDADDLAAGD
ncbi:MAG: hypothetical protein MHM6MM_002315 [Cercozoa sp. M6MM]